MALVSSTEQDLAPWGPLGRWWPPPMVRMVLLWLRSSFMARVLAGSTGGHTAPHGQGDMGLFHEEMGDIGGSVSSRLEERGPYMLW